MDSFMSACRIIDVDILVRVRRTLRIRRRIPVFFAFYFFCASFWDWGLGAPPGELIPKGHEASTWAVLVILALLVLRAAFSRDVTARLLLGVMHAVIAASIALLTGERFGIAIGKLLAEQKSGAVPVLVVLVVLVILILIVTWKIVIRYGYALVLSVLPNGEFRRWFEDSVAAEAARKRIDRKVRREERETITRASRKAFMEFVLLGSAAFFIASFCGGIVAATADFEEPFRALLHGRYWDLITFQVLPRTHIDSRQQTVSEIWKATLMLFPFVAGNAFGLMTFGWLWQRWRRSRIVIHRIDMANPMPPGGVLVLRHSWDDVMQVPKRAVTLRRLPFMVYPFTYTFGQLIATRLSFMGPMHSLDTARAFVPILDPLRQWLSIEERGERPMIRSMLLWLARLRRHLRSPLPPPGGRRFRADGINWIDVAITCIEQAKMIVAIIGASRKGVLVSRSLAREMELVRSGGALDKTLFLMPPIHDTWRVRSRWKAFIPYLGPIESLPHPRRVLGVCFRDGQPIIITGDARAEFHYQSVLDLSGSLVSEPRSCRLPVASYEGNRQPATGNST
jgi:hypothetical protein